MANPIVYVLKVLRRVDRHLRYPGKLRSKALPGEKAEMAEANAAERTAAAEEATVGRCRLTLPNQC
jgi:hypothetical protein